MPKDIEKQLIKKIKNFIWDSDSKSTISQDILCAPIEQGGKAMLHLEARNEAIELNWLKELVTQSNPWTYFANALLAKHVRSNPKVNTKAQYNYFLQSWECTQRHLPLGLQRIMKVKKKYNAQIEALAIPQDVKDNMPIWFHMAGSKDLNILNNHYYSACLRENHDVQTVGQMNAFITKFTPQHRQRKECMCSECITDRARGCKKPFECRKLAKNILKCIPPKWHPNDDLTENVDSLTVREKEENAAAIINNEEIIFDPQVNLQGQIMSAMRVFTSGIDPDNCTPLGQPHMANNRPKKIYVITSGKHSINEDGDHISGGGVWFKNNTYPNMSIRPPEELSSIESGELSVILLVLKIVPKNKKLHFCILS
jgi:hypothetical protein